MNRLIEIIRSDSDVVRHSSLESVCADLTLEELSQVASDLDEFRRGESNLYRRVRALFFLAAIYRYHLPTRLDIGSTGLIPIEGYEHLLGRRFNEAIDTFLESQARDGAQDGLCSALASAYHQLGFQTLADQVRRSVRSVRGNQWMFRLGHPDDHPLRVRRELMKRSPQGTWPILSETTAVRMDFSHSAWSDIFFLGMDFPEGARVLNVSIDLGVRGRDTEPRPPIETYLRIIDRPEIRLVSVDLGATTVIHSIAEVFDFARDYLGLLKAALIAAGVVAPGLEGCQQPIGDVLESLIGPGLGLELVSKINDIPKGSRLAVSTNLLGSLISILMRATGQVKNLEGPLEENDRRLVAARAILGEWLGGSGGGWQDSGGVWPGIKLICGAVANEEDPEFGVSRGRLMPSHHVMSDDEVSQATRQKLQESLVLIHGGMAQNVGPILEMVTEHYLLRSSEQWNARREAMQILDDVVEALRQGDIRKVGALTTRNFEGPLQTIIPWATNRFTDRLIELARERYGESFWGFWMLGGMAGGGMGFIFDPKIKPEAQQWLGEAAVSLKREMETSLPFAMDPVVYNFAINDHGTSARLLRDRDAILPDRYFALVLPQWLRLPTRDLSPQMRSDLQLIGRRSHAAATGSDTAALLLDAMLPRGNEATQDEASLSHWLERIGFDAEQHEQIRADLRAGRIGLSQNRLSSSTIIEDVRREDVIDLRGSLDSKYAAIGKAAIKNGEVAVVTLAAGVGSRWTQGAGVCKALHPFNRFAGRHRSFLEVHLAKNRFITRQHGGLIPHVVTTSYLTDDAIRTRLSDQQRFGFDGPLYISSGQSIGLRLIPMVRDLRFLWEETSQQMLDEQQQKVRESVRSALIQWAHSAGEGNDYTDNLPSQCVHPVGHWYEIPNMLRNGILANMLSDQPTLKYLMLHNIDTLGANVDPGILGRYIDGGKTLVFEVIGRRLEDRGGGLARVNGQVRLIEGLAMPDERIEFGLTFYNSMTTWISIDGLLRSFGLSRQDLGDSVKVDSAVRRMAMRMPTYVTLKDVKKRWGHAQEDVYPVAQFEKLWGDMTALPEIDSSYFVTTLRRGQQLKAQAQLDPWKRDGSADFIDSICAW